MAVQYQESSGELNYPLMKETVAGDNLLFRHQVQLL